MTYDYDVIVIGWLDKLSHRFLDGFFAAGELGLTSWR